jgi:hypothetical protein
MIEPMKWQMLNVEANWNFNKSFLPHQRIVVISNQDIPTFEGSLHESAINIINIE